MISYNHQDYVARAIESVVGQVTSFDICLFIGDDCSTDKTSLIIDQLAKKHPDKIRPIFHEKNIGPFQNAISIWDRCFSEDFKYVAACEADDFWTNPQKLQKQVDFLEANPDYSLCAHDVQILYEEKPNLKASFVKQSKFFGTTTAKEILRDIYIHTSSMVFCNKVKSFPGFAEEAHSLDVLLQYQLTRDGSKVFTFRDQMSVYRKHIAGISNSSKSLIEQCNENIAFQKKYYLPFVEKQHQVFVYRNILDFQLRMIELFREDSQWLEFIKYNFKTLNKIRYFDIRHLKNWLGHCAFPKLYWLINKITTKLA